MKMLINHSIYLIFLLHMACHTQAEQETPLAIDLDFYYEIKTDFEDDHDAAIAQSISNALALKKCAITNDSGTKWPFFEVLPTSQTITKQSLMKPHTASHVFRPFRTENTFNNGDAKLDITLKKYQGVYSFDMIIYKWQHHDWVETVNAGNHKIPKKAYGSNHDLINHYYKSIIRFSFK